MKKPFILFALLWACAPASFAQFSFIHLSDMHVSDVPKEASDTNARYFRCYIREFAALSPKPVFVAVSGDVSNAGNQPSDGMYPVAMQHLFPHNLIDPGVGDYFIDSARTIPIYFVPGNHEYWISTAEPAVSNDTLKYYTQYAIPDTDYAVTTPLAVIVFLRSGSDSVVTIFNKKGRGLTDGQIAYLRGVLKANSNKRKIIVMHHPAVNAKGTNSDGTPYTGIITGPDDCSIAFNRTTFLNICDSNHVDVVLNGHEHQNVVANRAGKVIPENGSDSTRYIQTAAGFNRSYRIITVDQSYVTVSLPLRSCLATAVNEPVASPGFAVYPNPATDRITIVSKNPAPVELLDTEGRVIRRLTADEIPRVADISDLPGGIYIIRATTGSGIVVKKLVKQ